MLRSYLEGFVDVVDREGDAVHANIVGTSGLRLDRFGMDVLKEFKATVTVWRLEHRYLGVVAIKADGGVGPLAADGVTADDREAEVGEKGDRCFEVANGDADILKLDGHAVHATQPGNARARAVAMSPRSTRDSVRVSLRCLRVRPLRPPDGAALRDRQK